MTEHMTRLLVLGGASVAFGLTMVLLNLHIRSSRVAKTVSYALMWMAFALAAAALVRLATASW